MPSNQLLKMTVLSDTLAGTARVKEIRFNLPRGRIARILGFHGQWRDLRTQGSTAFSATLFVLPSAQHPVTANPKDLLWGMQLEAVTATAVGFNSVLLERNFTLPKPFRTTTLKVVAIANTSTTIDHFLVIYYDTDVMEKGEATQILEGKTNRSYRGEVP